MMSHIKNGLEFYHSIWRPSELVISDMERRGVPLDAEMCPVKAAECSAQLEGLHAKLRYWAGQDLNWGSPKQVAQFLYGQEAKPATKKGKPIVPKGFALPPVAGTNRAVKVRKEKQEPTSEAALEYLRDHTAKSAEDVAGLATLLEWRDLNKLRGFWDKLPEHRRPDGRLHGQLAPATETGRLTMANPCLHQQPPEVREAFVAPEGKVFIALDYAALEWRVLAHVLAHKYGDMSLVEEILAGVDPHSATAVRMGLCSGDVEDVKDNHPKARADAKILNFSINYGKTARGLGVQIKNPRTNKGIGERAGQQLLDGFYEARPGVARFHEDIVLFARARGHVRSLLGRPRPIPELEDQRRWVREKGERLAKNVIQNCAADIVTLAMLRVNTNPQLRKTVWFNETLARLDCQLVLQIHDELLFEVPEQNAEEAKAEAAYQMENCLVGVRDFKCPLGVSGGIGKTWRAAAGK